MVRVETRITKIACILLLAVASSLAAENPAGWNRFRGPNGSGVAQNATPPTKIGTNNLAWRVPVPGGLSSPIVADGKVFLTAHESNRLVTLCFDAATGKTLWRQQAPEVPIEEVHEFNSPATPTPCADDKSLYVYFGSYGLLCYDFDGRLRWQKPLTPPKNLYGTASSPILYNDLLILVTDDDANLPDSKFSRSRIIALKKATGELAWETARPLQRSGWSTPAIWQQESGDQIVVHGSGRLCGYDAKTGVEKWFVTGFARETAVVPVFGNGYVFASSAMGGIADEKPDFEPLWIAMLYFDANKDGKIGKDEMTEHFTFPLRPEVPPTHPGFGIPVPSDPARRAQRQRSLFASVDKDRDGFWTRDEFITNLGPRPFKPRLAAIRSGGAGDISETHIAWELKRSIPELPSAIFHNGLLYLVRNGGILTAVNAADGKILYDERLNAPGQYSASPIIANNHLYLLSNQGTLTIVKSVPQFTPVSQHNLGEPTITTPALHQTTLYIRTQSHLRAYRD